MRCFITVVTCLFTIALLPSIAHAETDLTLATCSQSLVDSATPQGAAQYMGFMVGAMYEAYATDKIMGYAGFPLTPETAGLLARNIKTSCEQHPNTNFAIMTLTEIQLLPSN
jgi:hypothetical protein